MVKTRHGADTAKSPAESSRISGSSQKRRRETESTVKSNSKKKRKAPNEPEQQPETDQIDYEEDADPVDFHDSTLLPAFEEAALAIQEIQGHMDIDPSTDDDDSVLEVPLKLESPTQTVDIIATPSTRKETTAEPDGAEERTEYFTPQTSKKGEGHERGSKLGSVDSDQTPTARDKHIRFNSASPDPEASDILAKEPPIERHTGEEEDQESDEDSAPEEITQTAARQSIPKLAPQEKRKAKNSTSKKRKAAKAEKAKARATTKALNARITQDPEDAENIGHDGESSAGEDENTAEPQIDLNNLPDLLPDSVLNAPQPTRLVTPEPGSNKRRRPNPKTRKRLQANGRIKVPESKKVKDVKRGPVSVRVLEEENKVLAPKVARASGNIREQWLQGRQMQSLGKKGKEETRVERKGFGKTKQAFA